MSNKKLAGIITVCAVAVILAILLIHFQPWEQTPSAETYTLTTVVSPSGAGSISPSGGEYDPGVQVTLTASPAGGYTFDHWSGSASGNISTITVTMDSDKSLTANFQATAQTYTLTTNVSPSGAGSVSPSSGEYESGVQVTLTATPASGYTFNYWDGSASGSSNTVTITMYSNQTINAHFKIAEPGLTPTPCQERAGTFEFEDGTILHASHIGFIDFPHLQGQDYDVPPVSAGYYPYVTLETDIHKYWIREDWLWVYGFVTDGENLIPSCSTSTNCPMGRPAFSLEFLTDDGLQYSGSLDDVVSFSPDCPPLSPANKYTCETEIGGLRATWVSWEGESHELPVMAIEFVEWHYAGPGFSWITPRYGWHQYDTIQAVASGSGTNTSSQYEFNHLSGVEFSRQYDASREAVFTMSDGGKLEVNIIPRGTWSEIKSEGLLFSFYSSHLPLGRFDERYRGILLYVPFEKVKSVHWESF